MLGTQPSERHGLQWDWNSGGLDAAHGKAPAAGLQRVKSSGRKACPFGFCSLALVAPGSLRLRVWHV